jgi:membrane protein
MSRRPHSLRKYRALPWATVFLAGVLWPRKAQGATPDPPGRSETFAGPVETLREREPGRGRGAHSPSQIPPRGWLDIAWRTVKEVVDDRLPAVAGGVTFYTLLAIFPGLGAFVSLYGLFADVNQAQAQFIGLVGIVPREFLGVIGDQMVRLAAAPPQKLGFAFGIALLLAIWSASSGVKALFNGLNVAYDEDEKRGFVGLSLLAVGATVSLIGFMTLLTVLLVAVPALTPGDSAFGAVMRWLAALVLTTGLFSVLYRFGPSRAKPRWQWVSWGSGVAALLWMLGSLGFSAYVTNISNYDRTYGPLGAVIAFMVWIWFSVLVILVGAELNAEIEHQTAVDSTTGPPMPMGARGAAMADTVGLRAQVGETLKAVTEKLQAVVRPGRR